MEEARSSTACLASASFSFLFLPIVEDGERVISPNRRVRVVHSLVEFVDLMSSKLARVLIADDACPGLEKRSIVSSRTFPRRPTCARTAARSSRRSAMTWSVVCSSCKSVVHLRLTLGGRLPMHGSLVELPNGRRYAQRRRHQRAGRVLLERPQAEHERGMLATPCTFHHAELGLPTGCRLLVQRHYTVVTGLNAV